MTNENVFYGTKDDWLKNREYNTMDIYDDNFAIDFSLISIEERIKKGEEIEEPVFLCREISDDEDPF